MTKKVKKRAGSFGQSAEMKFPLLCPFATLILDHYLDDFVKESIKLARKYRLPVMKYFESMPERELFALALERNSKFLLAFKENRLHDYLNETLEKWAKDQLPLVSNDQLVTEDIILGSYVRKQAFLKFVPFFTTRNEELIKLLQEIDWYTVQVQTASFRVHSTIQYETLLQQAKKIAIREKELLDSQQIANIGSFDWNLADDTLNCSPQILKILEADHPHNLYSLLPQIHTDDKENFKITLDKILKGEKDPDFEFRYVKNDVEKVLWIKAITFTKKGRLTSLKGTIMDVSDRSRLIKKLQASEDSFKRAESVSHLGNWTWDLGQNSLIWTDELYRIYELPLQSEISPEKLFEMNYPDDRQMVRAELEKSTATLQPFEFDYRIILKDKIKTLNARGELIADANGKAKKIFGTLQDVTKQKEIEKELREKQLFIEKVANAAPSLITVYNIQTGKYLFVSSSLEKLLGYHPQRVLDEGVSFFISRLHPDDLEPLMAENNRQIEQANRPDKSRNGESVVEFFYRMRHQNGEYRWLHTYGTVFDRDANGMVEYVLNVSVDITEEYQLRKQFEEEKSFAEMVTEMSANRIFAIDTSYRFIIWNKECEKYYHKPKEEILGKTAFEVFPDFEKHHYYNYIQEAFRGEFVHVPEGNIFYNDGYGELFFIPLKKKDGTIFSVMSVVNDITTIKRTTLELEQLNESLAEKNSALEMSEERYHKMVEQVEDYAILLMDTDGKIENWNEGAEKIKGYKESEIIGKSFRKFYTQEDQENKLPDQLIERAREDGRASHEGWRVRKDGSKFWASVVITALHDQNNQVIGFSKVTRDLTERKLAEDRLTDYAMQLDKKNRELQISNKELSSFSYVASHDLQEPLRKIQTFGKRIIDEEFNHLSSNGQDSFRRMINAAERMQKLIDDLLAFSRAHEDSRHPEPVDLNVILHDVKEANSELIADSKTIIHSENLPVIAAIPFQIQQLFTNLITNAIKYRKDGIAPCITISAEQIPSSASQKLNLIANTAYWKLSFQDNGIGFDEKYAGKIFEIFQRLHGKNQYPGTGIGLAICKKIVENHHGVIMAHGIPGDGATFEVYLPAIHL